MNEPLEDLDTRAREIVDIAFTLHKVLGPGLWESVYEKCFCYELNKRNIPYKRQEFLDIYYDNLLIGGELRPDLIIDNTIIVELKAQETPHPVWEAQLLTY